MFPGPRRGPGRCRLKFESRIAREGVQSAGAARPFAGRSSSPPRLRCFAFSFHQVNARAGRKLKRIGSASFVAASLCEARDRCGGANFGAAHRAAATEDPHSRTKKTPGTLTVFPAFRIIRRCLEREVDAGAGDAEVVI